MVENMIKVLSHGFCKYLGRFHMLTDEECFQRALFREWSEQVSISL